MKKRISNAQRIGIAHTSRRTEDARCKSKECETKVQKKQRCGKREHKKGRESVREREQCVNDMANPANNNNGANWSPAKHDAAVD